MKTLFVLISALTLADGLCGQHASPNVVATDIANFWRAYDRITSTQDSILQYAYLDSLYFRNGTEGLTGIRAARNYTPQDYIHAINNYPLFWASIRTKTLAADAIQADLEIGIEAFRRAYPELKPAKIYFTIGALRTSGTVMDGSVLIGAELSMADSATPTSEFPERLSHLKSYFQSNPNQHPVFLNIHEYVHTQQKEQVFNILSLTLYEGVAEFVAATVLGVESPNPQIAFGKKNAERIREVYERELFYFNNLGKWLNSNAPNEFGMRDLGYSVGYQICEKYYHQAEDKSEALKTMIELDYTDEAALEDFIRRSNYFSAPLDVLYERFESNRPTVVGLKPFENNSQDVSPDVKEITVVFSRALNGQNTGVDYGELGEEAFPKGPRGGRYWSEDHTTWTLPVELEPNKTYQIFISNNFRTADGLPLKPFLIEFKTSGE
jgi:hypothetical protein